MNLLSEPADAEPPTDPALPIALPTGETLPLRDVLERSEQRRRALELPEIPEPGTSTPKTAREERDLDPWFKLESDEHGRVFPVYDPEVVHGLGESPSPRRTWPPPTSTATATWTWRRPSSTTRCGPLST